ncbi:MAG: potassium channel protein [Coleofasciculaceae cyanobacterium RL_1_1]|nr:potassium channel protein [Coleofasciculaceae cyanobacterium RL_1_1]
MTRSPAQRSSDGSVKPTRTRRKPPKPKPRPRSSSGSSSKPHAWRQMLGEVVSNPIVNFTVSVAIVVSIVTITLEVILPDTSPSLSNLHLFNRILTTVFAVELVFRALSSPSLRRFLREYWLDALAVLPILRALRLIRATRLLRHWTVSDALQHLTQWLRLPNLRQGAWEYVLIIWLAIVTLLFSSIALLVFERPINSDLNNPFDALWISTFSLFATEPIPGMPQSTGGRIVSLFIMLVGTIVFAILSGTVSAFAIEHMRRERLSVDWNHFHDHVIICGWNKKAEIVIQEYRAAPKTQSVPIIVVARLEGEPMFSDALMKSNVHFLNEDFTKVQVLEKAGIRRAMTCIILSDKRFGRTDQDADARTILAALTAEKLNRDVYTCAELINREYGSHLDMGHVNDYVVSEEQSGFLLAQASLNPGLMGVFSELLTYSHGNQFYRISIPSAWFNRSFWELFVSMKRDHNAILVAVCDPLGNFFVNPQDYTIGAGDCAIAIAHQEFEL